MKESLRLAALLVAMAIIANLLAALPVPTWGYVVLCVALLALAAWSDR